MRAIQKRPESKAPRLFRQSWSEYKDSNLGPLLLKQVEGTSIFLNQQLGDPISHSERRTVNPQVPGSSPGRSAKEFCVRKSSTYDSFGVLFFVQSGRRNRQKPSFAELLPERNNPDQAYSQHLGTGVSYGIRHVGSFLQRLLTLPRRQLHLHVRSVPFETHCHEKDHNSLLKTYAASVSPAEGKQ